MTRRDIIDQAVVADAELALLGREWADLTPLQAVQRLSIVEFSTPEEWRAAAAFFTRRADALGWHETLSLLEERAA
jgi:hypothetical protein